MPADTAFLHTGDNAAVCFGLELRIVGERGRGRAGIELLALFRPASTERKAKQGHAEPYDQSPLHSARHHITRRYMIHLRAFRKPSGGPVSHALRWARQGIPLTAPNPATKLRAGRGAAAFTARIC